MFAHASSHRSGTTCVVKSICLCTSRGYGGPNGARGAQHLKHDGLRFGHTAHVHEPTVDAIECAQLVPQDRGSGVIATAPGSRRPCKYPSPRHVPVENEHSIMEKLLNLLSEEDKIPVVRPHQVRRTGVIVIDIGASSDILGTDVAEQLYEDYIRPTGRQLEFSIANQKQVFSSSGIRMQVANCDTSS